MKIYVSSTYQDMTEERGSVLRAIRGAGLQPFNMENYGADPRSVVERCTSDVKASDHYLGIFGYRYGSLSEHDPLRRSFTHLEFATALEWAKVNPQYEMLIYVQSGSPTKAGLTPEELADLERMEKFRSEQLLGENRMAFLYSSSYQLGERVATDLGDLKVRHAFRSGGAHDLLPHLCDRTAQVNRLYTELEQLGGGEAGLPMVCILHGPVRQGHDMFIRCLEEFHLRHLVRAGRPQRLRLQWPREARSGEVQPSLLRQLRQKIPGIPPGADMNELSKRLVSHPRSLLFDLHLPTNNWSATTKEQLEETVRFWLDWPAPTGGHPCLVVIKVPYHPIPGGLTGWWKGRGLKKTRSDLETTFSEIEKTHGGTGRLVVLPNLENVDRDHLLEWGSHPEVHRFCGGRDVTRHLHDLLEELGDSVPMEDAATRLAELLAKVRGGD
jgi:uncharacterized protein DUF4062/iSTAND domain-containing protein